MRPRRAKSSNETTESHVAQRLVLDLSEEIPEDTRANDYRNVTAITASQCGAVASPARALTTNPNKFNYYVNQIMAKNMNTRVL